MTDKKFKKYYGIFWGGTILRKGGYVAVFMAKDKEDAEKQAKKIFSCKMIIKESIPFGGGYGRYIYCFPISAEHERLLKLKDLYERGGAGNELEQNQF